MKHFMLAVFCAAATLPLWAQAPKDSLASLIQTGNHKAALERIRAGADVNEAQPDGTRAIHWAVYRLDYEVLDALIARKAKVDVANDFGSTPLGEAAKLADARLVKALLVAGARPDLANQDGETPLMLATKTGELPIVEMLVKAGANVNARESFHNQTALMWAAAAPKNAGEMVKLLVSKDADVRPRELYNDWPSQITSEPRVQYRPVGGFTALLYAARSGCYDCVEELIGTGADINVPTPEGITPLMLALDNDHNDVAKLLLDRGANATVWDWWGRTALYIAVDRKAAIARGGGGQPGGPGRGGRAGAAPVARAPDRPPVSSMAIINALLAAGVDVNPQLNMRRPSRGGLTGRYEEYFQNTGCTPLMRATIAGDEEVVRALLDKGASPNISSMGLTPFLIASGVGTGGGDAGARRSVTAANLALMDLLLQGGADVNAQITGTKSYSLRIFRYPPSRPEGMSALHAAAQGGRTDLVRYLLEKGANPDLVDADGHKPIDLIGTGGRSRGAPAPAAATGSATADAAAPQATTFLPGAGGRGGPRGGSASPAAAAEIRARLQNAASNK
jgi:ankyrin repeat protein